MITLDSTLKSLEVKMGGAATTTEPPWIVAYVDISQTTFGVTASSEGDGTTNGATAVTMVAAPSAGVSREIKHISVINKDTIAQTITVQINNNGTKRIEWESLMQPGDKIVYEG